MPRHVQIPPMIIDGQLLKYDDATDTMVPANSADIAGLVNVVRDRLVASGGESILYLGENPASNSLLVWKNGTLLWPVTHYTIIDNRMELSASLSSADVVEDYYFTASPTSRAASFSAMVISECEYADASYSGSTY